jgi:hypothetical protein
VALGTDLRAHETGALDVGDVLHEDGRGRQPHRPPHVQARERRAGDPGGLHPEQPLVQDSAKLVSWKRGQGETLAVDAPLFVSRRGRRISTRTLRYLFAARQRRAGFDPAVLLSFLEALGPDESLPGFVRERSCAPHGDGQEGRCRAHLLPPRYQQPLGLQPLGPALMRVFVFMGAFLSWPSHL